MILNNHNYHSIEANKQYMSISQFKEFMDCESRAIARLEGIYKPSSNALVIGSYVHSAFESEEVFDKFNQENNHIIFNKKSQKYADFIKADEMIQTIKDDKLSMYALDGEKEQIYTFRLFKTDWKMRIDSINHAQLRFSDLKTTQDLHKRYWSNKYGTWVSFVDAWGYVMQMALYRKGLKELTGNKYEPYIIAVTKESPPNKAVIEFDELALESELEYIESNIEHVLKVKFKEIEPSSCGICEYCRSVKKLSRTVMVDDLI
jgi:hypothetical protein